MSENCPVCETGITFDGRVILDRPGFVWTGADVPGLNEGEWIECPNPECPARTHQLPPESGTNEKA